MLKKDLYQYKNRRKYALKTHIVLVTKYRRPILQGFIAKYTKNCMQKIADQYRYSIIAMESDQDHIHILLSYDTTDRICDVISHLKQNSTYYLWNKFPAYLQKYYWKQNIFWSDGYFACSIGEVSQSTIEKYIAEQG